MDAKLLGKNTEPKEEALQKASYKAFISCLVEMLAELNSHKSIDKVNLEE